MDRAGRAWRAGGVPSGRCPGSRLDAHEAFIVGLIKERPDIALNEMADRLAAERSVEIGRSGLSAWLRPHRGRTAPTF